MSSAAERFHFSNSNFEFQSQSEFGRHYLILKQFKIEGTTDMGN